MHKPNGNGSATQMSWKDVNSLMPMDSFKPKKVKNEHVGCQLDPFYVKYIDMIAEKEGLTRNEVVKSAILQALNIYI